MNHNLVDVFTFLPSEMVAASDLKCGDIAFIHSRWGLVLGAEVNDDYYNQGANMEIPTMNGGTGWLPPTYDVKIIRRDLLDHVKIQEYIEDYLEDQRKWEEIAAQEEKEEREREIAYLKERLEHLEDD